MRDLPLNALRAFVAVHRTGGIRPAGRLLGVAHSAVARHLRDLEALLGTPLIEPERDGRTLVFTAAGERLGTTASAALGKIDQTWGDLRERRSTNAVTISATPSFAALWLLPRLGRLAEALPGIEVSVLAEHRVRDPADEGSDLSIRMGRIRSGETGEPLMDDALTPVAAPRRLAQARAARGGPTGNGHPAALLHDLPLLHDRDPNAGWALWAQHHCALNRDLDRRPRFASSDLVLRAAKLGQGVALARLRLANDDLRSGALERLSEASVMMPDAYWLIGRTDRQERARVQAVRAWLKKEGAAEAVG